MRTLAGVLAELVGVAITPRSAAFPRRRGGRRAGPVSARRQPAALQPRGPAGIAHAGRRRSADRLASRSGPARPGEPVRAVIRGPVLRRPAARPAHPARPSSSRAVRPASSTARSGSPRGERLRIRASIDEAFLDIDDRLSMGADMNKRLDEALTKVNALSDEQQNEVAELNMSNRTRRVSGSPPRKWPRSNAAWTMRRMRPKRRCVRSWVDSRNEAAVSVDSSCRYQGHSRVHCPGQSSRGSRVVRRIEKAIDRLHILPVSGRPGVVTGTRVLVVPGPLRGDLSGRR